MENKKTAALATYKESVCGHPTAISEQASELYHLSLRHSIDLARHMYFPISGILGAIPDPDSSPLLSPGQSTRPALSRSQCDLAFDAFVEFDSYENPFPPFSFLDFHEYFNMMKHQLDTRSYATSRSLLPSTVSAMAALLCGGRDVLGKHRLHLQETNLASKQAYVHDRYMETLDHSVKRLHDNVESDKLIFSFVLESGRGQPHVIREVLRHLRKNHTIFWHLLSELEEHVCCYLYFLNQASFPSGEFRAMVYNKLRGFETDGINPPEKNLQEHDKEFSYK